MDENELKEKVKQLREDSPKRNFSQAIDLIVTLRDLNLKNPDEQLNFYANLSHGLGKKMKVGAFVGPEMKEKAEEVCDTVVPQEEFDKYKDKKKAKKLADEHDYFIAQADIMPKVATAFGKVLGPRGKMPNPKLGSVLPGKAPLEPVYQKLQNTISVTAKNSPMVQVKVGKEDMKDDHIVDNISQVYNQILNNLPKDRSNVNKVLLKLTMSKPVEVDL